jgi:molecular chaperone DnaK
MAADNISLGMFHLTGIPPAPRGVPQIEVTFDIDVNGILHVTAKDLATGKEVKTTITSAMRLSKEEKERLIKEAEKYVEEDRKKKELAEALNAADSVLYTAEKTKAELTSKMTQEQIAKLDQAMKDLREAMQSKDLQKIKSKTDELSKILQEIGTYVYQQTAQQRFTQTKSEGEKKVVDADYKVVDEEKR